MRSLKVEQMLLKDKQVAIIGAGPVGLTLARLLQQKEVSVTVYERDKDPDARIWGGTLDLHKDSGQVAMREAGLLEQYYAQALPMGVIFADEHARMVSKKELVPEHAYDNPEINRDVLRKILLGSLVPGTVIWNSRCTGLEVQNSKWVLQFGNKATATADLVICANGGMSKVRSYVTDTEVKETGTFIIQGDVPQPELTCPDFYSWCNGYRLMAAYGGDLMVVNPCNGDALSYGVIFRKPHEWADECGLNFGDLGSVTAYLSDRFSRWNERYHQLFCATNMYVGLPTKVLPLDKPWKNNRPLPITLTGDAAHLMPPFAGQGVNIGLTDASILAANLTGGKFGTITAAISDYERQMFVYAAAAQKESRENELDMHKPDFSFDSLLTK